MAYIFEYLRNWLGKDFFDRKFKEENGGVFYDLGSGTGKAVIAMALFCPFKKLIGIEYLENLWELSLRSKGAYDKTIFDKHVKYQAIFTIENTNKIEFYNGDFLRQKWNDASVVFANSTCFSNYLMEKIGIKAMIECKVETILITVSKKLNNLSDDWEFKDGFKRLMTWGVASIYIYIRRKVSINKGENKLFD